MQNLILIFFTFVFSSQIFFAQDLKEKAEETILNEIGKNAKFEFVKYQIPKETKSEIENSVRQKFFKDFVYLWKIKKNKNTYYALLDNVYGKSLPITFLVIFDNEGNIISSSIVKYREPYGGGVTSKNWNAQFINKNYTSSYEVGKDIVSISGATISVRSVTTGIHKLTLLLNKIKSEI